MILGKDVSSAEAEVRRIYTCMRILNSRSHGNGPKEHFRIINEADKFPFWNSYPLRHIVCSHFSFHLSWFWVFEV
jgi:hypothetical protein